MPAGKLFPPGNLASCTRFDDYPARFRQAGVAEPNSKNTESGLASDGSCRRSPIAVANELFTEHAHETICPHQQFVQQQFVRNDSERGASRHFPQLPGCFRPRRRVRDPNPSAARCAGILAMKSLGVKLIPARTARKTCARAKSARRKICHEQNLPQPVSRDCRRSFPSREIHAHSPSGAHTAHLQRANRLESCILIGRGTRDSHRWRLVSQ